MEKQTSVHETGEVEEIALSIWDWAEKWSILGSRLQKNLLWCSRTPSQHCRLTPEQDNKTPKWCDEPTTSSGVHPAFACLQLQHAQQPPSDPPRELSVKENNHRPQTWSNWAASKQAWSVTLAGKRLIYKSRNKEFKMFSMWWTAFTNKSTCTTKPTTNLINKQWTMRSNHTCCCSLVQHNLFKQATEWIFINPWKGSVVNSSLKSLSGDQNKKYMPICLWQDK